MRLTSVLVAAALSVASALPAMTASAPVAAAHAFPVDACPVEGATAVADCLRRHGVVDFAKAGSGLRGARRAVESACAEVAPSGLAGCLERAEETADVVLDALLGRARDALSADGPDGAARRAVLDRSQAAWVAYADAACRDEVAAGPTGPLGTGPAEYRCRIALKGQRAAELELRFGAR